MRKSETYVRDHVLIQFMIMNYAPISFSEKGDRFIEEIYQDWINWLKEMEEKHDQQKRSKV